MKRFALTVAMAVVVAAGVRADVGPPPGSKYVPVTTTVKLEKEFADYSFYVIGVGPGASPLTKVELDPKKATKVDAKSRYGGSLYAVPNAVVKEFKTEKELTDAIVKQTTPAGVVSFGIGNRTTLKESDKRTAVEKVLVVSADEKAGVKIVEEKQAEKKEEKEPEEPTASAPFGGKLLIVGLAAALALVAGGLWVVRRK